MNQKEELRGNILIVDDTLANLDVLAGILRDEGYKVRPAPSGKLALRAIKAEKPDLVLLDIRMPEMDGYEVCRQVKADDEYKDIPIIFISALTDTADKIEAFKVGGVDYVTKPFHAEEVLARVSAHLKLQRTLEALEAARVAAESANVAKSTFLRNMSHELRSPLNIILGYTSLMQQFSRSLPNEQRENLNVILRSGEHLHTMIDNILDLSKIEAGVLDLEMASFDLHHFLDDLEDMFALWASEKNLAFNIQPEENCPKFIRTDAVKLRQILINLLGNAITFTEEGGIILRVGPVGDVDPDIQQTNLVFEIEDSGPGILDDEFDRIFEPFFQGEAGKKAQTGTGLGLAISQEFVQLFGSELIVETTLSQGTQVKFELPVELTTSIAEHQEEDGPQVVALAPDQANYKILIADDKWANRQILFKLLQPMGFDLREARHGAEAVEIWETWQPDLVWIHLRMPVMDGFEATRRIKSAESGQNTVIIAVTASAFDEERATIEAIGSDDFLRRPYRLAQVYEMLEKHLEVKFLYDDDQKTTTSEETVRLDPEALAALPEETLTELSAAVRRLDVDIIEKLITQIKEQDEALGIALDVLTGDFKYDQILEAIQKI